MCKYIKNETHLEEALRVVRSEWHRNTAMRTSTRDDSARPSVKTHYMDRERYKEVKERKCDAYSELPLELRERFEMNPVHRSYRCVVIRNVYSHFSCCYYDTEKLVHRTTTGDINLPEAEPDREPLIYTSIRKNDNTHIDAKMRRTTAISHSASHPANFIM